MASPIPKRGPGPPAPAPRTASRPGGPQDRGPGLWVHTLCLGTGLKQQPLSTSTQRTERGTAPGPTAGLLSQGAAPRQASVMAAQGAVTPGRGPRDGEMAAQGFRGDKRKGVRSRGLLRPTAQTGRAGPPPSSPAPGRAEVHAASSPQPHYRTPGPCRPSPSSSPRGPRTPGGHTLCLHRCALRAMCTEVHRVPPAASSLSASLAPLTTAAEEAQN